MIDKTTVQDALLYPFQDISDHRGDLYVIEGGRHVPFDVKRLFWITRLPQDIVRGGHAHRACQQFIVAVKGSLDVELDDGETVRTVHLDKPSEGLLIPAGIWATEKNYSEDVLYLVLASDHYDEADYFRCYEDFIRYKHDSLS